MSVDLRGFEYPLEPLRKQRQWQLDTLLSRLGKIQHSIQETNDALSVLQSEYIVQCQNVARSYSMKIDPCCHERSLQWLVQQKTQIRISEEHLSFLEKKRLGVWNLVFSQQNKVDVIEAHRDESATSFAQELSGKLATQADREWLASASFRRFRCASDVTNVTDAGDDHLRHSGSKP